MSKSILTRKKNFTIYDRTIDKEISFRPVTLTEDLQRIHQWMNCPHVIPFWKLNFSLEKMYDHLIKAIADPHQTLYIGSLNGVPISYWESYWAIDDIIANYYPAEKFDQGIHLLIGDTQFLGQGLALPLLRAMVMFQFQTPETQKIMTEPDARNQKMIHIFKKCGFEFQKEIDLPDKTGALMKCDRTKFEELWDQNIFTSANFD
ncbi:GNAT family N-acetyltransferase [Picosynechococcus sp. NKBG15041c]|uniref:GNAT family N-acetyltransferase n=1 Tax=Picosynechococcus sp. NKBG15041c TaxID=1407650 RepID=UPI0004186AC8|nr:GNAT family N-acetyltransferase [Picosynechococcus sp. NKBG15041c]